MDPSEQPVTGAAQRRKQRRLRSWWRHEQQSIAAALATFQHHSSRGQRKARAGEEESEVRYTAAFWTTPPPEPELFDLFVEPGGLRPTGLVEPRGPQERIQRHTAEQMIESFVPVPMLDHDAPVPQMVDQLVDMLKLFDNSVPEQVIDVPKISQDAIPQRTVLCEPQLAEQLVEVPTPLPPTELFIASDGHEWCRIAGRTGVYFWRVGTQHTQWRPPEGYTGK